MLTDDRIVDLYKTLADPNRLHLFTLLLHSDYTNSELMSLTDLSQNLLSHHLNILTDSGLIVAHRSTGDARRRYYSPNFEVAHAISRWWLQHSPPPLAAGIPALKRPRRVLFLCLRNAARSLIPEALAHHIARQALVPYSAGIEITGDVLPPLALRVLGENGIPTDMLRIQNYRDMTHLRFDYVITVCDLVHEYLPPNQFPGATFVHWSLRDPEEISRDKTEQYHATQELLGVIRERMGFFVQQIAAEEQN